MSLRVGVVGVRRGRGPAAVFHSHADCELVAVADRNEDVLQGIGEQFNIEPAHRYDDIEKMLASDIDAVFVSTPAPVHAEHTIAALQAGKHVMCEVPAVYTIEQAQQVVRTVKETGLKYAFAENMCYYPYVLFYRQLVAEGEIGEIVYAEGEYIHNCESLMVDRPDGLGGGSGSNLTWRASLPPIQYCTHDLGPLLQMFEDRCTVAVGFNTGNRRRPDLGAIDLGVGLFQTEKDITIKQLCAFSVAKHPSHHWFSIYGTTGHLEQSRRPNVTGQSTHYLYREHYDKLGGPMEFNVPTNDPTAPPEATVGGHGTSEYFMVDGFVRCILEDTKPPIDVYEAMDWTLPGICAHISAEAGGEPVEVPDPREW